MTSRRIFALLWFFSAFFAAFWIPFIVSAYRTIWQQRVPADVQGRVFSAEMVVPMAMLALGYLAAGPLADRVFEPAMQSEGALAAAFGGLVGTGPGAGMGLMFVCTSIIGCVICLSGYLFPAIRNVERDEHPAQQPSADPIGDAASASAAPPG